MKTLFFITLSSIILLSCKKENNSSNTPNSVITIPTVVTTLSSSITTTTALSGGNISGDGGATVTARGVCWSTSINPTTTQSHTTDGNGSGIFVSTITGLIPNTTYYVRAYATNSAGTAYGSEVSFVTVNIVPPGSVTICSQVWMAKNLDVANYQNGDPIPKVTDDVTWSALTTGAYCYYNNDSATYAATYGKLYNWYAVNDPRGLAPLGWHIPTNGEWLILENCLGGLSVAGGAMKEAGTVHWVTPNTGATNSSGFNALPSGYRTNTGTFGLIGKVCYLWSSTLVTTSSTDVWQRSLFFDDNSLFESSYIFNGGVSVRCIKN